VAGLAMGGEVFRAIGCACERRRTLMWQDGAPRPAQRPALRASPVLVNNAGTAGANGSWRSRRVTGTDSRGELRGCSWGQAGSVTWRAGRRRCDNKMSSAMGWPGSRTTRTTTPPSRCSLLTKDDGPQKLGSNPRHPRERAVPGLIPQPPERGPMSLGGGAGFETAYVRDRNRFLGCWPGEEVAAAYAFLASTFTARSSTARLVIDGGQIRGDVRDPGQPPNQCHRARPACERRHSEEGCRSHDRRHHRPLGMTRLSKVGAGVTRQAQVSPGPSSMPSPAGCNTVWS